MTESSSGGNTLQTSRLDKTDIAFDSINMALLVVGREEEKEGSHHHFVDESGYQHDYVSELAVVRSWAVSVDVAREPTLIL